MIPQDVRRLTEVMQAEMKLAMQQSQDLARARKCIEAMLGGDSAKPLEKEAKRNSEKNRPSPIKAKTDLKAHFSEPPAPPPQAPLPEKPDVARALADPLIQPLLRRADTARPSSASSSPTRMDHSSDILRLCEELKLAKGELTSQAERMKGLESQLAHERTARASAEERAHQLLENTDKGDLQDEEKDAEKTKHDSPNSVVAGRGLSDSSAPELQAQLERLQATMDEMKQQMEAYRQRAESAESERDEARQGLAEMVEQKRKENAASKSRSRSRKRRNSSTRAEEGTRHATEASQNGAPHSPISSSTSPRSPTATTLLERAGLALESGQAITPEQARIIQGLLSREVLGCSDTAIATNDGLATSKEGTLMYHGRPLTGAAFVVVLGVCLMGWMNSWPKMER